MSKYQNAVAIGLRDKEPTKR